MIAHGLKPRSQGHHQLLRVLPGITIKHALPCHQARLTAMPEDFHGVLYFFPLVTERLDKVNNSGSI